MTHISSQPDTQKTDVHTRDDMITMCCGCCNKMCILPSVDIVTKFTKALFDFFLRLLRHAVICCYSSKVLFIFIRAVRPDDFFIMSLNIKTQSWNSVLFFPT